MLHVSDLLHYKQCPRLAWNWKNNKPSIESFYHMDCSFSSLYTQFLHIENYGQGKTGDSNEVTMELIEKNEYVLNARLEYKECRTNIPVIHKLENGIQIIYPFLSAYPKEFEATKMKINQLICEHCGLEVVDTRIIYINKDYIRQDSLDLNQLFFTSDCLFNKRNHPGKKIKEYIESVEIDLDEWIAQTKEVLFGQCPELKRTKQCTAGRRCRFYEECFDESKEPDDSTLFLTTSQYKLDAYYSGIQHIKDMPLDKLEGYRLQYAQYMASKNGQFLDRSAIIPWLQQIKYPISYLDFEWDTFAIPPYQNMKPFDVLCFQYSLHVEYSKKPLKHFNFFDVGDCRKKFVESLIHDIPKRGSILVYNMEGAEKLRLMQLSMQFPEYKKQLISICNRMIDLSKPFETGCFYDNRMRGHYSLKKLLPVFTDDISYTDLSIQNGLNAVWIYRTFEQSNQEDKEKIRNDISTYCALDTYAEYVVYHGLLKKIKEIKNA